VTANGKRGVVANLLPPKCGLLRLITCKILSHVEKGGRYASTQGGGEKAKLMAGGTMITCNSELQAQGGPHDTGGKK